MFDGHWSFVIVDIAYFMSHYTLKGHVIKGYVTLWVVAPHCISPTYQVLRP